MMLRDNLKTQMRGCDGLQVGRTAEKIPGFFDGNGNVLNCFQGINFAHDDNNNGLCELFKSISLGFKPLANRFKPAPFGLPLQQQ